MVLIGNSPWQNPAADQLAMFAYWVSMVLTPIIFLDDVSQISRLKRTLIGYGIGYTFIALLGQLLPAGDLLFLYHIW
jgi:hypothetical protein